MVYIWQVALMYMKSNKKLRLCHWTMSAWRQQALMHINVVRLYRSRVGNLARDPQRLILIDREARQAARACVCRNLSQSTADELWLFSDSNEITVKSATLF